MSRVDLSWIRPTGTPFKFSEQRLISEFYDYVSSTYGAHYAQNPSKTQALDLIESAGLIKGFCGGSIIKYATRLGKKSGASVRDDLMKIMHYALILLHFNDQEGKE